MEHLSASNDSDGPQIWRMLYPKNALVGASQSLFKARCLNNMVADRRTGACQVLQRSVRVSKQTDELSRSFVSSLRCILNSSEEDASSLISSSSEMLAPALNPLSFYRSRSFSFVHQQCLAYHSHTFYPSLLLHPFLPFPAVEAPSFDSLFPYLPAQAMCIRAFWFLMHSP